MSDQFTARTDELPYQHQPAETEVADARRRTMILVAMYDAEHSTRSVDDELNWKKDIARRLR